MLAATLMLIALSAETQRLGQQIRREREEELIHRGKQYVRAIKLYYKKFGAYPATIEQLEKINNLRFLRQRYKDPMTGDDDWRLIHAGEAKPVKIKGFGGAAGGVFPGGTTGAPGGGFGGITSSSGIGPGSNGAGGLGAGSSAPGGNGPGSPGVGGPVGGPGSDTGQPVDASTISKSGNVGKTLGGGPIVGIASSSKKESIKELNQKNHYNEWEFVYDPRTDINGGAGSPIGPGIGPGIPGANPTAPGPGVPPPGIMPPR